ncbi:hypothetical protein BC943DRAFT_319852, partial [Umbelopsis sp. AD052]
MKTLFVALTFIFCAVSALVYTPKVTSPDRSSVWQTGKNYTVTWDIHSAGAPIPDDETASLYLGYLINNDRFNEHLYWELASGFKLNAGSQEVKIPQKIRTRH